MGTLAAHRHPLVPRKSKRAKSETPAAPPLESQRPQLVVDRPQKGQVLALQLQLLSQA